MKKAFLFMSICLVTVVATAQKSKFEWGISSGMNVSKIQKYEWQRTDVPLENPIWLVGSQLDLAFRYRLFSNWTVKANVQAVQKGWKGQTDVYGLIDKVGMTPREVEAFYTAYYIRLSTRQNNRISYLSVPISVEYYFWQHRLYAQVGGYWALVIDSPWNVIQKTHEWGAQVGLGFRQPISKQWLINFETTYIHGFSNIYNSFGKSNTLPELATGNRTLAANLGFVFRR